MTETTKSLKVECEAITLQAWATRQEAVTINKLQKIRPDDADGMQSLADFIDAIAMTEGALNFVHSAIISKAENTIRGENNDNEDHDEEEEEDDDEAEAQDGDLE